MIKEMTVRWYYWETKHITKDVFIGEASEANLCWSINYVPAIADEDNQNRRKSHESSLMFLARLAILFPKAKGENLAAAE